MPGSIDCSRWMENNYDVMADMPLDRFLLPGSHDSGAFALAQPPPTTPTGRAWQDILLQALRSCFGPCIMPWTLTQAQCVYEQLALGARFLDIRLAYDPVSRCCWAAHTFSTVPLAAVVKDIGTFLSRHGREVVVLWLRADWTHREAFGATAWRAACSELMSECKDVIYRQASEESRLPTLRRAVERGGRLLVFADAPADLQPPLPPGVVWAGYPCLSLWANRADAASTLQELERMACDLAERGELGKGGMWVASAAATPSAYSIVRATLYPNQPWGLQAMAADMSKLLPEALARGTPLEGVQACTVDYLCPNVVKAAVSINVRRARPTS